jgi:hypothetical protein
MFLFFRLRLVLEHTTLPENRRGKNIKWEKEIKFDFTSQNITDAFDCKYNK